MLTDSKAVLFKFRSIDKRAIESIVFSEVYFSKPEQFNDPFDCKIPIMKSLSQAILVSSGKEKSFLNNLSKQLEPFFLKINTDLHEYGVFCGSMNLRNHLMWSHYANSHKGISLAYDIPKHFMDHTMGEVIGVHPVDYQVNPISEWFLNVAKNRDEYKDFEKFGVDLIVKILTTKDKCWSYEEEGRIISQTYGLKNIGAQALKQICFGLKTSQKDKDLIRSILDKSGHKVIFCEMEVGDSDFDIREKLINS